MDVSSSHQTRYLRTDDEEALDSREESIQSDQNAPSRDWSEEESSDTEHPLPPNAIAIRRPQLLQQTSSSLSSELPHSILAHSRPQSTPAHSIHLPETTPLLSPSFQPDSLNPRHSHSRRPRYPGLRQRRSNTSLHGGESLFSRRFSIVSTNLQEAIVEKRGHSTKYQTLFNLINCLIGIGLLAMPYVLIPSCIAAESSSSLDVDVDFLRFDRLAFADAGWIGGTILLAFASLITLCQSSFSLRLSPSTNASPNQTPLKSSHRSWQRTRLSKRTRKSSSAPLDLKHGRSSMLCSRSSYRH